VLHILIIHLFAAAELTAGSSYTVSIDHGTCRTTHYQKRSTAWIDFNGNEVFEASEQLGPIATSNFGVANAVHNITFTVPSGVCGGSTRMRVVLVEVIILQLVDLILGVKLKTTL